MDGPLQRPSHSRRTRAGGGVARTTSTKSPFSKPWSSKSMPSQSTLPPTAKRCCNCCCWLCAACGASGERATAMWRSSVVASVGRDVLCIAPDSVRSVTLMESTGEGGGPSGGGRGVVGGDEWDDANGSSRLGIALARRAQLEKRSARKAESASCPSMLQPLRSCTETERYRSEGLGLASPSSAYALAARPTATLASSLSCFSLSKCLKSSSDARRSVCGRRAARAAASRSES
mmetsp:Transcript_101670/g.270424  ORF Transcript_101670/g.270424 Transcript_101670/m.270424 type:complete len:233 (-) Transcript_101670:263-961(-)